MNVQPDQTIVFWAAVAFAVGFCCCVTFSRIRRALRDAEIRKRQGWRLQLVNSEQYLREFVQEVERLCQFSEFNLIAQQNPIERAELYCRQIEDAIHNIKYLSTKERCDLLLERSKFVVRLEQSLIKWAETRRHGPLAQTGSDKS